MRARQSPESVEERAPSAEQAAGRSARPRHSISSNRDRQALDPCGRAPTGGVCALQADGEEARALPDLMAASHTALLTRSQYTEAVRKDWCTPLRSPGEWLGAFGPPPARRRDQFASFSDFPATAQASSASAPGQCAAATLRGASAAEERRTSRKRHPR